MHALLALLTLLLFQPAPTPAPPAASPPAAPAQSPTPLPAPKEVPAIDRLDPASRKLVEKQAANFIVTQDGKYWDRQVWLKRQELRDKMRRSVGSKAKPTDADRAHGASSVAPMDPNDESDGIKREKGVYYYGTDLCNPPLWRAADGTTAITAEEIAAARNAVRPADAKAPPAPPPATPAVPPPSKPTPLPAAPIRDNITPAELAEALLARKAELSIFRWSRRTVKAAQPATATSPATPEEAEFSWHREPLPVKWLKETSQPTPGTPGQTATPEPAKP
jgi:hypothetical protein